MPLPLGAFVIIVIPIQSQYHYISIVPVLLLLLLHTLLHFFCVCFSQIVTLLYLWSLDTPVTTSVEMTGLSRNTIVQWFQYARDVCSHALLSTNEKIGGPGCYA